LSGAGEFEFGHGGVPAEAEAAAERASSVYLSVISEQTFIGCWQMNAELASLLSLSLQQLQDSAPLKVSYIRRYTLRTGKKNQNLLSTTPSHVHCQFPLFFNCYKHE